jgi:phage recombination protein Bet
MSELVTYKVDTGEITLSPEIVRQHLVSGDGKVTDQEVMMFLALCKHQRLNPFLREVYLIKYGDKSPATMVTGKEAFLKRAQKNPKYAGHQTGISDDGKVAWAKVYVQGYEVPIMCEVDYNEYVGMKDEWLNYKKTGRKVPNSTWGGKPRTMLKKVALVQALREAFTTDFQGMYSQEEINTVDAQALPKAPVKTEVAEAVDVTETETPSVPKEAPPADPKSTVITKQQGQDIFLKATANLWPMSAVKGHMKDVCGVEKSAEIKQDSYNKLMALMDKPPMICKRQLARINILLNKVCPGVKGETGEKVRKDQHDMVGDALQVEPPKSLNDLTWEQAEKACDVLSKLSYQMETAPVPTEKTQEEPF